MGLMYMQNNDEKREAYRLYRQNKGLERELFRRAVPLLGIYMLTILLRAVILKYGIVMYYVLAIGIATVCFCVHLYRKYNTTFITVAKFRMPLWIIKFTSFILFNAVLCLYEFIVKRNENYIDFIECLILGIIAVVYAGCDFLLRKNNVNK